MELSIESLWRTTYHYILPLVALLAALYAIGWSIERVLQLFTVFFLAMLTSSKALPTSRENKHMNHSNHPINKSI
jgi:hypothetical protein